MITLITDLWNVYAKRLRPPPVIVNAKEAASTTHEVFPPDFDSETIDIIKNVRAFTQTSSERIFSLCAAVKYLVKNDIPGDIVECGVWRGGSMKAVALSLIRVKATDRDLHLFDTYEGMPDAGKQDVDYMGLPASEIMARQKEKEGGTWNYASLDEVSRNLLSTEYPAERLHFHKGMVEDTLPDQAPERISLLRLDTDFYQSTKHELATLFPRLSPGGVLIIDDYGHFAGARQAVDEYFKEHRVRMLLNRIDYTGRIGVVSW